MGTTKKTYPRGYHAMIIGIIVVFTVAVFTSMTVSSLGIVVLYAMFHDTNKLMYAQIVYIGVIIYIHKIMSLTEQKCSGDGRLLLGITWRIAASGMVVGIFTGLNDIYSESEVVHMFYVTYLIFMAIAVVSMLARTKEILKKRMRVL